MRLLTIGIVLFLVAGFLIAISEIHFVTEILFIAAAATAILGAAQVAFTAHSVDPSYWRAARRYVITIGAMVLALDALLRLHGAYSSYPERTQRGFWFAPYRMGYTRPPPTWYHMYRPHMTVQYDKIEFTTRIPTNALGFCDREFDDSRGPGEFRVVAVGDSFTEGVGAPAEAAWPRALQGELNQRAGGVHHAVFNGGISGSDPWFEYVLLRDKLATLNPDVVVLAINNSDIGDIMQRGGIERFQPDGRTRYTRERRKWEWLYGLNYLTRHFVHGVLQYDFRFMRAGEAEREELRAVDSIVSAVVEMLKLGRQRGFELVVITHPDRNEAFNNFYAPTRRLLTEKLNRMDGIHTEDFMKRWRPLFVARGVDTFYWPMDGHHNSEGYSLFAKTVADLLYQWKLVPNRSRASESVSAAPTIGGTKDRQRRLEPR